MYSLKHTAIGVFLIMIKMVDTWIEYNEWVDALGVRLSWKWIGRGVNKFNIVKSCTLSVNGSNTMLTLCYHPV